MEIKRTEDLKNWRQSHEVTLLGKAEFRPGTESDLGNIIDFFPEVSFSGMVRAEQFAEDSFMHELILSTYCVPVPGLGRIKTRNRGRIKATI